MRCARGRGAPIRLRMSRSERLAALLAFPSPNIADSTSLPVGGCTFSSRKAGAKRAAANGA